MSEWITEKWMEAKKASLSTDEFAKQYLGEYTIEPDCFTIVESKPPPKRYIVIAESYHVFHTIFLDTNRYRYLGHLPQDIRGYANMNLLLFDCYWRHPGWTDEVLDYCNSHNITIGMVGEPF
jgi:hypothetical protein